MVRKTVVLMAVAGAVALAPAAAEGAPASGAVVVGWRAHSHTATLAYAGRLVAVHSARPAHVGSRVVLVRARRLANGTLAAALKPVGTTRHARVRAVVVATLGRRAIALGAHGTTIVVRLAGHRHGQAAKELTPQYGVGSTVSADVTMTPGGSLESDDVQEIQAGAPGAIVELEGKVAAVDLTQRFLLVTVSDNGMTASFTVLVPDTTIDLTRFKAGDEVELRVTKNQDGTLTLTGSAKNGDDDQADDPDNEQGDCHGDGGDHHHGDGGDSRGGGDHHGNGGGDD